MTRSHLRAMGICALVLLVAVAPAAFGADPRDTAIPSLGSLANALDALFGAADNMVGTLVPVGKKLLALAVVLELLYAAYMFFIKGGASDFLASGFRTLIVTSVPLALLASWPDFPRALMDAFTGGVTELVTGHAGGASDQVGTMLDQISKMSGQLLVPVPDGFWQHVSHPIDTTVDAITNLLVGIVMIFATVMFGCALLFATFGPLVMLKIGIIVGPLLLPLLVWKPTSDIGMKWFTFMLSMCVAYVLGLILAQLAMGAIGAQVALVQQQSGKFDTVMVTLLGLLPTVLAMVFCGFLLLKVEHIAAALIGGASIGSGAIVFAGALGAVKGGGGKGGGGGDKKGGADKTVDKKAGGEKGGGDMGGNAKGQADMSKQAADVSGGGGKGSRLGATAGGSAQPDASALGGVIGGNTKPSVSAPGRAIDGSAKPAADALGGTIDGSAKPAADALGGTIGGSTTPEASAPGDVPKAADSQVGEKAPGQDSATPSRAARFTQGAWAAGKVAGKHGWKAAKAVGGTGFGKAAAFTGATLVTGPIGGAVVGAFAVSPKLRGMVGKAGDLAGKGAVYGGDKLVEKITHPKPTEAGQESAADDPKDTTGE